MRGERKKVNAIFHFLQDIKYLGYMECLIETNTILHTVNDFCIIFV